MDLQSGKFYWPTTMTDIPDYSVLDEDITCDVLIIGGGSSGAQCAYYLSDTDLDIVVVDKRKIGTGSTSVNTALLQYLGDKMLFELVNSFGEEKAIEHTKLCEEAINEIEKVCSNLNIDAEFKRRDSLYYASYSEDTDKLRKEYYFLKKHDFQIDLLKEQQIGELFPFKKELALHVKNDGEINPFKFNHGLLSKVHEKGVRIYENTNINGKKFEKDQAVFFTEGGHSIKARYVIIASGYENLEWKREKNTVISSSYAVVTNRIENFEGWHKQSLIWETARPYIYMRTTADNRIIIGGLDEDTDFVDKRDSKLLHKKDLLIHEFNKLFPHIKVHPEFYLSAYYGGTHDGLPMIGEYESFPNCYFLFAYGDNGLVYSMALAKIIRDIVVGGSHPATNIYHQARS